MVLYNNLIPFKGYKCINLFGILFVRKGARMTERDIRHEVIHTKQCIELLGVFFYIIYLVEWLIRLSKARNAHEAYRSISFEKEAYTHENEVDYKRKHFAMWRRA